MACNLLKHDEIVRRPGSAIVDHRFTGPVVLDFAEIEELQMCGGNRRRSSHNFLENRVMTMRLRA